MSRSKFIDQARIFVQAGSGGKGHVGFRRVKFIPRGGPDGGDGGRGGSVILVASPHVNTLQDFQFRRHFRAKNGEPGGRNQRTGKDGEDLTISVPLGTVVIKEEGETVFGELVKVGERLVIAPGGKGGLGNLHFKSSTNQAPRRTTPGEARVGEWVHLELKLLADVGIVGPPNAGKSTLLGAMTSARPKVGNYPFTTLTPSLGVLEVGEKRVTLADVPGLIEGAHRGTGLGIEFLRHLARTRVLIFLVSTDLGSPREIWSSHKMLIDEIRKFDPTLLEKPNLAVLNKIDLKSEKETKKIKDHFAKLGVTLKLISAQQKEGLIELKNALADLI